MGRPPRVLDPTASVPAFFGSELRRLRMSAGLTQARLGAILNYSESFVAAVETARRTPSRDFAESADAALATEGELSRLWPLVSRGNHPSWFQRFAELESGATSIHAFEVQVIPGLLQTELYMRAVLEAGRGHDTDEEVERHVAARLERQRVLDRAEPPMFWAVIGEGVLRCPVGGAEVMRDQLERLLEAARRPRVVIQVLPFTSGAQAPLNGAFWILTFDEGLDVAYMNGSSGGLMVDREDDTSRVALEFDVIRAVALSPQASVHFIEKTLEDL